VWTDNVRRCSHADTNKWNDRCIYPNLLMQLSIFLIDLFVGTYRLSSHARLDAFVIQTKLN
jgi:hypothetical protein